LFDYNKDSFNEFTCVSVYLKLFYHNMLKNRVQNTSNKVQSSISHTPEGTNTARWRLTAAVRSTSKEGHDASACSKALCTTPVASGGE
jgi:hypothetical protein